jgi:uncharacterized protein
MPERSERRPPSNYMESIKIPTKNTELDALLFKPTTSDRGGSAILFVHGWTSRKERSTNVAAALAEKGFICLLFDLRGHGQTPGDLTKLSLKDFVDDCIEAYDYLKKVPSVNSDDISVVGSSLGSYLAAVLTSERKTSKLVLRVPADYSDEIFEKAKVQVHGEPGVAEWRKLPRDFNSTRALRAVHNFAGKIFIIESGKDDIVDHQIIENYLSAVPNKNLLTFFLMENAPHSLSEAPDQAELYNNKLIEWFENNY